MQQHRYTSHTWKVVNLLFAVAIVFATSIIVASCDNDNDDFPSFPINRPNAVVTVKPSADGSSFYMQLDDSTLMNATNMKASPYANREVRAFVNYRLLTRPASIRKFEVYVNWIDSILTKPMAASLADVDDPSNFRQDPVDLLREWTVCEDGYLTLHFRTQWAANSVPHIVNLAPTNNSNPYDLTFYHNAQGVKGGYWSDGVVAFRLDKLPNTNGKTVDMTLRWTSFGGPRNITFKYSTRKGSTSIQGLSSAQSGQFEKAIR